MIANFSEGIKSDLIKLGVYQIIGGFIGITLLVRLIFNTRAFNEMTLLFYVIIILFFCYSVLSGWMCVKFNKNALRFSLINQFLDIGIDFTASFKINFDAGLSNFNLYINNQANNILFNFNLIAFYLVYWIERLRQQVKLEDEIKQSDSIGEDQNIFTE